MYDDDPEAQYEVSFRKEKTRNKAGVQKTRLVMESLTEQVLPATQASQSMPAPVADVQQMAGDDYPMHEIDMLIGQRPRRKVCSSC